MRSKIDTQPAQRNRLPGFVAVATAGAILLGACSPDNDNEPALDDGVTPTTVVDASNNTSPEAGNEVTLPVDENGEPIIEDGSEAATIAFVNADLYRCAADKTSEDFNVNFEPTVYEDEAHQDLLKSKSDVLEEQVGGAGVVAVLASGIISSRDANYELASNDYERLLLSGFEGTLPGTSQVREEYTCLDHDGDGVGDESVFNKLRTNTNEDGSRIASTNHVIMIDAWEKAVALAEENGVDLTKAIFNEMGEGMITFVNNDGEDGKTGFVVISFQNRWCSNQMFPTDIEAPDPDPDPEPQPDPDSDPDPDPDPEPQPDPDPDHDLVDRNPAPQGPGTGHGETPGIDSIDPEAVSQEIEIVTEAEAVEVIQDGPTGSGTEIEGSQDGGLAPGGGDESVASEPGSGAPANPDYDAGTTSTGTNQGTSNGTNSGAAQTEASGQTATDNTSTGEAVTPAEADATGEQEVTEAGSGPSLDDILGN